MKITVLQTLSFCIKITDSVLLYHIFSSTFYAVLCYKGPVSSTYSQSSIAAHPG